VLLLGAAIASLIAVGVVLVGAGGRRCGTHGCRFPWAP
jgi:hypothetical protein